MVGPSVLAVFNQSTNSTWPNIAIATGLVVVMAIISVVGIRMTARTQVIIGIIEYAILIVLAVWGLTWVARSPRGNRAHHVRLVQPARRRRRGSLVGGFLIAVFMFTGWDGTLYVNEEVKHRRENPGRAAMMAVGIAAVLFILAQIGLQGVASYNKLNNNSTSVLVYLGDTLTGHSWGGTVAALALALSVIAATGVGIVLSARIAYGIASYHALPESLANVSQRFKTPAVATVVASVILLALGWIYLLTTSVQNAFSYVLDNTGILYATFYCVTALAAIVYYRRRVLSNLSDAITLGLLPLASIVFLGYVAIKSMLSAPAAQNYSLLGFLVVGLILLLIAKFVWKSSFFETRRESWKPGSDAGN